MSIDDIKKRVYEELSKIQNEELLDKIKFKYLGRKGEVTKILRSLKDLPIEERRELGPKAQKLRQELEDKFKEKLNELVGITAGAPMNNNFDITKPGERVELGHLHPLTIIEQEIRQIFFSMNFSVVEGPEVETEHYNFDALNMPRYHPAREMQDTLWLKQASDSFNRLLLRTQTSPVQIRYMEKHNPPIQIIAPGRVFRHEATDFSHEINFHQVEGLMVGKDVSLANFEFVIEQFFNKFFGQKIEFRFRPSYFPFVEPGVEVDIKFKGKWLEVMGAGMVHRKVFEAVKYNPNEWQGFAFGMNPERLAMIKYNIPDIRLFHSGDLRFIKQF